MSTLCITLAHIQYIFPGKASTIPKQMVNIGKKSRGAQRFKRWYDKNRDMKIAKVRKQRAGLCYCPNRYNFPIPTVSHSQAKAPHAQKPGYKCGSDIYRFVSILYIEYMLIDSSSRQWSHVCAKTGTKTGC